MSQKKWKSFGMTGYKSGKSIKMLVLTQMSYQNMHFRTFNVIVDNYVEIVVFLHKKPDAIMWIFEVKWKFNHF